MSYAVPDLLLLVAVVPDPIIKHAVRLLIHRPDGTLLVVNRRQNDAVLCLPGGKVDPGETLAQALVREVAEETGLSVAPEACREIFVGDARNDRPDDTTLYRVTTFHVPWNDAFGAPRQMEEDIRPRWVSADRFANQCMAKEYDHAVLAAWRAALAALDPPPPSPRRR